MSAAKLSRASATVRPSVHMRASSAMASQQRTAALKAPTAWAPQMYSNFRKDRLRPPSDLLSRVPKLSGSHPNIVDVGCGDGQASKLLLSKFPTAKLLCLDSSEEMLAAARGDEALASRSAVEFKCEEIVAHFPTPAAGAPSGNLYDLIFANASLQWCAEPAPQLMSRMLARVRPGGALAVQMPDSRQQPSHVLLREVASEFGLPPESWTTGDTTGHAPDEYAASLLGSMCQELDMWTTTYIQRLEGEEPVFDYVRATSILPLLPAFGGEGSEQAVAFEGAYRAKLAAAYPKGPDGSTLYPFTRFFLVARRPSLLEVYSEYAAYHDHQLTKGWKS